MRSASASSNSFDMGILLFSDNSFSCMYNSFKYDFIILEIEVDKNHIHLMVESEPKVSPLMIVRVLKQQTTVRLWNDFSKHLQKHFWKEKTLYKVWGVN
jgi:Transposase and inactivated derivatives